MAKKITTPIPEPAKLGVSVFLCRGCGGPITLRAAGQSTTAVCSQCFSIIDVSDENYAVIDTATRLTVPTVIALGARGRIADIEWEAIGYMQKTDGTGLYSWDEYLLFNPYHGFRFLVQANGHWTYYKVLNTNISARYSNVQYEGDDYAAFIKGEAVVKYIKGEFYWQVKQGERAQVADFVAPPKILSFEKTDQEMRTALGVYVSAAEVASVFGISKGMPAQYGVASNQPPPYHFKLAKIWAVALCAALSAFFAQIISAANADKQTVYDYRYSQLPFQTEQTQASPSFDIPKDGNILIQSQAPVQNTWLELNLTLVNDQTNEEYNITQAIEYYFGWDDGNWSEGSQNTYTYISSVPAGSYKLLIDTADGLNAKSSPLPVSIKVVRDVPSFINFVLLLIPLFLIPLGMAMHRWFFENRRWGESDFPSSVYNPIKKSMEEE
jgi:Domain of unknown function (DUF4178)